VANAGSKPPALTIFFLQPDVGSRPFQILIPQPLPGTSAMLGGVMRRRDGDAIVLDLLG